MTSENDDDSIRKERYKTAHLEVLQKQRRDGVMVLHVNSAVDHGK